MNEKSKVRKFWDEHKKEIVAGVVGVAAGVVIVKVTGTGYKSNQMLLTFNSREDAKTYKTFIDTSEQVRGTADRFIDVAVNEFTELAKTVDGEGLLMDATGIILKPVGAIVFANEVK